MENLNFNSFEEFKIYALEKMEECKTLIANQPLTSDLAFDIYEIACYLNEIRRQENWETDDEFADTIIYFYNAAMSLESAVKEIEETLEETNN